MFYEAMLTSGVPPKLAKLMYFGVYYGGPRWDELTIRNSKLLAGVVGATISPFSNRPAKTQTDEKVIANAAAATIGRDDPSVEELASLADGLREGRLSAQTFFTPDATSTVGFALANDPDRIISKTPMQTVSAGTFYKNQQQVATAGPARKTFTPSDYTMVLVPGESTSAAAVAAMENKTGYKPSVEMHAGPF